MCCCSGVVNRSVEGVGDEQSGGLGWQCIEIGNPETPETHLNSSSLEPENLIATPPKGDAKDQGQKSLVVMHSNSVLSVKVANLQDDIEILKEANHFRRAYETILKMYEQKNSRLVSEKLQLQQMTINLNSVIKKLEQDEQKCQTQILNLQYENLTLMTKIEALQLEIVEQESCTQTIKNQERRIKELTDLHSQMLVEKQAIEHSLSFLQEAFTNAQQQLQESEASRKDQKKQLDKLKSDHIVLQDKNKAEVEQKNKSMNQCMEMEYTICKKEKEIEKLCHANGKLESEVKATTLALENLKEEKIIMEKQLLSLQEQLKLEADVRKAEQEQFETKYSWLVSEVKLLKVNFESEQEETESLKQHMDVVMKEHFQYKEQAAVIKDLNHQMMAEIENWKHRYEKAIASHHEKILLLNAPFPPGLLLSCSIRSTAQLGGPAGFGSSSGCSGLEDGTKTASEDLETAVPAAYQASLSLVTARAVYF
ncbi:hypothetical protein NDU88_005182 [Pleurodeles waltl]|uniref:Cancer-associated gene protein 1 N-terminal domain-containing protein n=1 Tax=Pleurodeles waltl TaxID=8319 RepID=A0AAV7VLX3_PLEWA|nr:hypothetical protein NDU88_005182 [Pleurodeles waltl]